jgi:mono/diheme cytochrome c family protein
MREAPCAVALLLTWVGVAGTACDALPGRPVPAGSPTDEARFEALYARHCAGCHGAEGALGAARPLDDPAYLAWIGNERLKEVTAHGVPGTLMPGFAESAGGPLDDPEVELLAKGIARRWGSPAASPPSLPYSVPGGAAAGDPERGARAFATHCARCHGPRGRGGARGGSVVDPDYLALVSDQALRTAVVAGRVDLGMPGWRREDPPGSLSGRDVSDLVAWLASQRHEDDEAGRS